ncbi:hypothetical protein ESCO_003744 [Escovopsis weberi]|uniref:YTH domain-containing protein n=1 Tax=Escovopsis weberi TaxID=150374 RepID=A0A0M8N3Z0_ESCWE|nr:hypothetical protein ESCO_003744 [Escovopsis weberi]
MVHPPSPDVDKARWMSSIHWETCDPFRVEWLNTRPTEFWEVGKLRNPFFENRKVFVGRDGQEYNADCGRKLIEIMDHPPARFNEQTLPPAWKAPKTRGLEDECKDSQPADDGSVESVDCANWQPVRLAGARDAGGPNQDEEETRSVNLIDW